MRSAFVTALLGLGLLAGCDLSRTDGDLELAVATRSTEAVSAKTNLVLLAERFSGEPELAGMTEDAARARALELLASRLANLALLGCDPQLVTDPVASTLDTTIEGCRIGLLRIDGEMHARVAIELAACDTGMCPTAVVWTLDDFDLEIGAGVFRPRLSGSVTLRDPVDASLPMTWSTGEDFVIETRVGAFATRSTASWAVLDNRCVQGMQLEARLDRLVDDDDADADLDAEVGTIVLSAQEVDRCPGKCPTSGLVRLSFGRGRLLAWDYAGETLDVVAPGGLHFTTSLVCDE